jgi:hypothetical protein
MNDAKYIGMDVHQATISAAVRDSRGNLAMEAILETKAETILQFVACAAVCPWPLKKEPGLPGCTICSSLTSPACWPAIRARMRC